MKRYYLFGEYFCDEGLGWDGFIGKFQTIEKARWLIDERNRRGDGRNNDRYRWAQIVDIQTHQIVARFENPFFETGEWDIKTLAISA